MRRSAPCRSALVSAAPEHGRPNDAPRVQPAAPEARGPAATAAATTCCKEYRVAPIRGNRDDVAAPAPGLRSRPSNHPLRSVPNQVGDGGQRKGQHANLPSTHLASESPVRCCERDLGPAYDATLTRAKLMDTTFFCGLRITRARPPLPPPNGKPILLPPLITTASNHNQTYVPALLRDALLRVRKQAADWLRKAAEPAGAAR